MNSEVSVVFQVSAVDLSNRDRDGVVGIGTKLQAGRLWVGIPAGARYFSFRPKVQTASGDGFLLCWYRGFFPVCRSGGGMMLTTDLCLAHRLRMPSQHGQEQLYLFAFHDAAVKRFCFSCMRSFRAGNANGTALLVRGSRDGSPVTGDFFPGHQTVPCALGSTQPLKMSTRIFLGVKTAGA